ncbi:MAG: 16S rRNA (guanine(966)-N(2))-methyltransferase RsmD [Alphaproteobacteria bacterium]|nr:16S rRNA (guanine(966)-N(2))-methyltransferase RsmD [Alphaproteobacteria bacterium]
MRILAGRHRGRRLVAPEGLATRPTGARARAALFNILDHAILPAEGRDFAGARVLDLFAGSGALGLEALSRGAAYALFVDEGPDARAAIRSNIEALGETGRTRIFRRDARALGPRPGTVPAPFDLVFCDAPYGSEAHLPSLASAAQGWLAPGALAVVETAAGEAESVPEGFAALDGRVYGETRLAFLRWAGGAD